MQRWPNKVDLRAEWPLQGKQSEKVASGRCSPISTNHVALFGLSCTRLGLVSTLHLALAIFQQGAPCFGHRPYIFVHTITETNGVPQIRKILGEMSVRTYVSRYISYVC